MQILYFNTYFLFSDFNWLDPCPSAVTLSDPTRSKHHRGSTYGCDSNLTNIWYRFNGGRNSQMLAEGVVRIFSCGTSVTGYLDGRHPSGNNYDTIKILFDQNLILMIKIYQNEYQYLSCRKFHSNKYHTSDYSSLHL